MATYETTIAIRILAKCITVFVLFNIQLDARYSKISFYITYITTAYAANDVAEVTTEAFPASCI